jgi:hypothetical protein
MALAATPALHTGATKPVSSAAMMAQRSSATIYWAQKGSDLDGEAAYDHFGQSVSMSSDSTVWF